MNNNNKISKYNKIHRQAAKMIEELPEQSWRRQTINLVWLKAFPDLSVSWLKIEDGKDWSMKNVHLENKHAMINTNAMCNTLFNKE